MEAALGLALGTIGLSSLFRSCVELIQRAESYLISQERSSRHASNALLNFKVQKLFFLSWGEHVGLIQGDGGDLAPSRQYHKALEKAETASSVMSLLQVIHDIFQTGFERLPRETDISYEGEAKTLSHVDPSEAAAINYGSSPTVRGMKGMSWIVRNEVMINEQLKIFEEVVQQLNALVPNDVDVDDNQGSSRGVDARAAHSVTTQPAENEQTNTKSEQQDGVARLEEKIQTLMTRVGLQTWIMGSFAPYDSHEDNLISMTAGTCEWILSRAKYQSWLSSDDMAGSRPKILWINGLAGAGKTMLCSRIVAHVHTALESPSAHFFFSSRYESCSNPYVAIRSWVSQIVGVNDSALRLAEKKREQLNSQDEEKSHASKATMNSLLADIAHAVPGCTFIMDGLDECTGLIPEFLLTVQEAIANSSARLLIVSRDEPRIRSTLTTMDRSQFTLSEYVISQEDVQDDVERLSREIISTKLSNKTDTIKAEISKSLAERADGQFLWVKLQAESLRRGMNKTQLDKVISNSPADIITMCQKTWDKIQALPEADKKRATALLSWTAFAIRPLTVRELIEAVLIDSTRDGDFPFDADELPDVIDLDYIDSEITALCPFIMVHPRDTDSSTNWGSATIHLTHYTVKEFMLSHMTTMVNGYPQIISEVIEHSNLTILCLHYIKHPLVWQQKQFKMASESFAFFDYAVEFWLQHYHVCYGRYQDSEVHRMVLSMFDRLNPIWDYWTWRKDLSDGRSVKFLRTEKQSGNGSPGPLYYASLLRLTDVVASLLRDGHVDVNEKSGQGRTALGAASVGGDTGTVLELLYAGADIDIVNIEGLSPIHLATIEGHIQVVELLAEKGANTRATEQSHKAPLMSACELGFRDIAEVLFNYGADIDEMDVYGSRPLHRAIRRGRKAITELLIEKGAGVNLPESNGIRPLHIACYLGYGSVVELLLGERVNINIDQTMMHDVRPIHLASHRGNSNIVRLLIAHGADLEAQDSSGKTALHNATAAGHEQIVTSLLEGILWTGRPDRQGTTALHLAVRKDNPQIVRLLLAGRRADISAADREGWTALHFATNLGKLATMTVLVEAGVTVNVADVRGWTALHLAARYGSVDAFMILINAGADATATTNGGWSALSLAIAAGNLDVMRLLITSGTDIEAFGSTPQSAMYKSRPLHVASSAGKIEAVKILVNAGADLESKDKDGCTALFLAVRDGHEEVVKFLIEKGADMRTINAAGASPGPSLTLPERLATTIENRRLERGKAVAAVDDTEDSTSVTISSQSRKCVVAFESLSQTLQTSAYSELENAVEDEAGRFQIWAGNIGALQRPQSASSLDSRLKTSELMRSNVQSGLERLENAVQRATLIISGKKQNRTEDGNDSALDIVNKTVHQVVEILNPELQPQDTGATSLPTTELSQLFLNIQSCISHLFSLSVLIRRDRPRGRTQRANAELVDIHPGPDITNVKDKFPKLKQSPWLAERVGSWITQQREYVRYRQNHRRKMAQANDKPGPDGQSILLSGQVTTKATTFQDQTSEAGFTPALEEDTTAESIWSSATSFATTAPADIGAGRRIPELTDMWLDGVQLGYDTHIECPYCRTIQKFKDRNQWKRHVYSDLQLYVCTFPDCSARPFSSSHEWFKHEMETHRRQWKCNLCNTKCESSQSLKDHFATKHAKTVPPAQRAVMVKAGEQALTQFDVTACLLCDNWKQPSGDAKSSRKKFRSHLEKHLQELAREALPLAIDGLEIKDVQDQESSDSEDASDAETRQKNVYNIDIAVVSPPPPGSRASSTPWRCLGPGKYTTLCTAKFTQDKFFLSHYELAHAHIQSFTFSSTCLHCGNKIQKTSCDSCSHLEPNTHMRLNGTVSKSETVNDDFVAKLEIRMEGYLSNLIRPKDATSSNANQPNLQRIKRRRWAIVKPQGYDDVDWGEESDEESEESDSPDVIPSDVKSETHSGAGRLIDESGRERVGAKEIGQEEDAFQKRMEGLMQASEVKYEAEASRVEDENVDKEDTSHWTESHFKNFPEMLRAYGSNWDAIAKIMETKPLIVKNHYLRLKDPEWEAMVREADEKNEELKASNTLGRSRADQDVELEEETSESGIYSVVSVWACCQCGLEEMTSEICASDACRHFRCNDCIATQEHVFTGGSHNST